MIDIACCYLRFTTCVDVHTNIHIYTIIGPTWMFFVHSFEIPKAKNPHILKKGSAKISIKMCFQYRSDCQQNLAFRFYWHFRSTCLSFRRCVSTHRTVLLPITRWRTFLALLLKWKWRVSKIHPVFSIINHMLLFMEFGLFIKFQNNLIYRVFH